MLRNILFQIFSFLCFDFYQGFNVLKKLNSKKPRIPQLKLLLLKSKSISAKARKGSVNNLEINRREATRDCQEPLTSSVLENPPRKKKLPLKMEILRKRRSN